MRVDTALAGREKEWTFVGRRSWREKAGVLYPPVYCNPLFDRGEQMPPEYYCEYARLEYAYPTTEVFSDVDARITFEQRYAYKKSCGIVLRAIDSVRFYAVEAVDMGRKGHDYRVSLILHDGRGYLTEIACGYAPHSVQADAVIHGRITDRRMWEASSPDPATLRVVTEGPKIKVLMDGRELFTAEDSTFRAGASGIFAMGPVRILDYRLDGTPAGAAVEPWHIVNEPRLFFYPVPDNAVEGYHGSPVLTRSTKGEIILTFFQGKAGPPGSAAGVRGNTVGVAFTTSADDGRTWSSPKIAYRKEGYSAHGGYCIYPHEDGRWTLLMCGLERVADEQHSPEGRIVSLESTDRGETWSEPREMILGGKPASSYEMRLRAYSPILRLSDSTLIQSWYWYSGSDEERRARSFVIKSPDDGRTWSAPIFIDNTEFDTNECAIAEVEPGHLVAFMRTLRARNMWRSESRDYGQTWTALVQSTLSATCPLLMARGGALVLAARNGGGNMVTISFDSGHTWTKPRIILVGGMGSMIGLSDGRFLLAAVTWWGNPARIRAHVFRLTAYGPEPALEGYENLRYSSDLDLLWRDY